MAPKKKQEKMALGDFLTNQSLGSWADEMDSQPIPSASSNTYSARDRGGEEKRGFGQSSWERSGSGVGGGERGGGSSYERQGYAVREALPFPDKPPYTAHLGNLAFDVSQADVEGFLQGCEVTSVRIVEDKLDRKPKGFGYVEFGTLDGLKKALTLTDSPLMGRNVRISIAEPPKERAESTRDFSDWSRKGPLPDIASQGRQPSRGFSRGGGFDAASDAGSERGGPGGARRPGYFQDDGKVRDFGNWERKGPLTPAPGAGPPAREGSGNGELRERRDSPSWGEGTGRSEAGSRPPRREFQERPPVERAPTAADQDSQWRAKMRPDAPSPAATTEASAPTSPAPAASRPKLNLTKRTVSTAQPDASDASSDAKASPFGAARPADTAQRDREIAEKREIAIREKKEADDKAKEEKTAKEAAARKERADRADKGQNQQDEKVTSPTSESAPKRPARQQQPPARNPWTRHQNGDEAPPQKDRPTFNVLKHDAEGGDEEPDDVPDAPANGTIVGDKDTKPQEITREVPKDAGEGAVQNTEPTAEAMEDDGWSTVAAKPKSQPKNNNRRGGARALAS